MSKYTLEIELLSETVFGMGAGVSGLVDAEIQHDEKGLPLLSGRAVKGLLVDQCSQILYALPLAMKVRWEAVALRLFGARGETLDKSRHLIIGDGMIAPDLAAAVRTDRKLTRQMVLDSLTDIRRQTAMSPGGAPKDESLRAARVLLSGLTFYVPVILSEDANEGDKALLAACVLSLRRAGLNRTRGKGSLKASITQRPLAAKDFASSESLSSKNLAPDWFKHFKQEVIHADAASHT